ncbi:MAG: hypothetical protein HS111_19760 [Kofleriaceae bacterium]|nr:hypothetical protein [Kofleriaceae bacterium]MCL4225175.1 hypothetical protein [Myxococcales bacterium]
MSAAMENGSSNGNRGRMYKVIAPVERKDGTTYWMRVGTAYPNKDASINLYLDAWPTGQSRLQIREMTDEDFTRRRPSGTPIPPTPKDMPF